ncbi:hypothetical protein DL96DRAFT_1606876 [Flagelloscypha sp. PMI_526]|nr:hypothetical protein DL96DRAFT_1606876 [Flagelloscypha sp. PMI_526]
MKWVLPVTTSFLGALSSNLRDFHYQPLSPRASEWIPPSAIPSLKVLQNFSLSIATSSTDQDAYYTDGLSWLSETILHLQNMTTLKTIRVDTNELPVARVESKWHVEPDVFQALSDLGDAFQLLSGCKIAVDMDTTSIAMQDGGWEQVAEVSHNLRECLSRSRDSNDIQIHFRSFVKFKPARIGRQPIFHFHMSCRLTGWTGSCGCWAPSMRDS